MIVFQCYLVQLLGGEILLKLSYATRLTNSVNPIFISVFLSF